MNKLTNRNRHENATAQLANLFLPHSKTDHKELEILWLADQLFQLVKDEPTTDKALKIVSKSNKNRN